MAKSDIYPVPNCHTWNPITGCDGRVSPGCDHCWAFGMANRYKTDFRPTYHADRKLKLKAPANLFVGLNGDMWSESAPARERRTVLRACNEMAKAGHNVFLLTKRPAAMAEDARLQASDTGEWVEMWHHRLYWGITIEDQERYQERIPYITRLARLGCSTWLNMEPLLGPVNNIRLRGWTADCRRFPDLVVVGGESGSGARPMHPDWVRRIRDECLCAYVPFFFKQWGSWRPYLYGDGAKPKSYLRGPNGQPMRMARIGKKYSGRIFDGQLSTWLKLPEELKA